MKTLLIVFAIASQFASQFTGAVLAQDRPTVTTQQGQVRGTVVNDLKVFRGIPYAAPPVGDLRWRPAQPPTAWEGTRDAEQFGGVCPQALRLGYNAEDLSDRSMQEDCLTLNVWTLNTPASEPKPVMVWMLPGGFTSGDSGMAVYNGSALATQGMVVVTFNYRLGYLGQFAHPALSRQSPEDAIGTYYLSDQVRALEWVRDNIAAFGGDPANVTIFGMSAGGVSVNYLMGLPAAKGLFHKAMSQSSNVRPYKAKHISIDRYMSPSLETTGAAMATALVEDKESDAAIVAGLRALTWEQVLDYQNKTAFGSLNPAVDGIYLPEALGPVFSEGRQHPVPYLTGATSWEGSLLMRLDKADLLLNALQISREEITELYGDVDDRTILNNLEFDTFFGSQRWLARQHAKTDQPTYLYRFDYVFEEKLGTMPGAPHGAETAYVFKTIDATSQNPVSDSDRAMANLISAYWVNFAKTGTPNAAGLPDWPRHTTEQDVLLDFSNTAIAPKIEFERDRMQFIENRYSSGEM
ncbi:MAG: carboxylesterase family protein [Rhodospirillaceae bacterium]